MLASRRTVLKTFGPHIRIIPVKVMPLDLGPGQESKDWQQRLVWRDKGKDCCLIEGKQFLKQGIDFMDSGHLPCEAKASKRFLNFKCCHATREQNMFVFNLKR